MQLFKLNLDPDIVQTSIDHFAFDLHQNNKTYKRPLETFLNVLKQGGVYFVDDLVSSEDRPILKTLVEYHKVVKLKQKIEDLLIEVHSKKMLGLV